MSREFVCPECGGGLFRLYMKSAPHYKMRPINEWRCYSCKSAFKLTKVRDEIMPEAVAINK